MSSPMLIGRKRGMTQVWTDHGERMPVTVLDLGPNTVTAVKTVESDGYEAVQLGFGEVREKLLNKPQIGLFRKLDKAPRRHLREVRGPAEDVEVGQELTCDIFAEGSHVDVVGTSKGKGFQGAIKRHGFSRGPTSHGSSNVRRSGAIGMHQFPGRVLKGKKMAGRMGGDRVTVKNLRVVSVDAENNVVLVRGAVPGCNGSLVIVRASMFQPASES